MVVYSKSWCPYCQWAVRLLNRRGVPFTVIDVTADPDLRREMVTRSGGWTVPQIFIGGEPIGGYDELVDLERSGRLTEMLSAIEAPTR